MLKFLSVFFLVIGCAEEPAQKTKIAVFDFGTSMDLKGQDLGAGDMGTQDLDMAPIVEYESLPEGMGFLKLPVFWRGNMWEPTM